MSKNFRVMRGYGVKKRCFVVKVSIKGFSLTELLIALFVFALISGFAYRSVNMLTTVTETVSVEESELSNLQRAFLLIERDIRSAFKIEYPASFPDGEEGLSLAMISSVDEGAGASKKSIRYVLRNKDLYRQVVFNEEAEALITLLLRDVDSMEFVAIDSETSNGGKVVINHISLGQIQRHIIVPFRPADDNNSVEFAALDTLEELPLGPSTVGGPVVAAEDEVPIVLDEADVVADGW